MKTIIVTLGIMLGAAALAACAPPPPPSSGPRPYLDQMYTDITVTPQDQPASYGAAPPIDPLSGPSDPFRRPIDAAGNEVQRMWIADPLDNTATNRPAIVWIHGGGCKAGIGSAYGLLLHDGLPYAKRGYVGISIEYRIDTTSDCQYVQDHEHDVPQPADWAAKYTQCRTGILAAQQDAQAAVRWVRRNAARLHVDRAGSPWAASRPARSPRRMSRTRSDGDGTWSYAPGDDPP